MKNGNGNGNNNNIISLLLKSKHFFLSGFIAIIFLYFTSNCLCEISISKLNQDILSEFNYYKPAIFLNSTHFSCDEGSNIFEIKKFNDDFCDCIDGADENSKKINKKINKNN